MNSEDVDGKVRESDDFVTLGLVAATAAQPDA